MNKKIFLLVLLLFIVVNIFSLKSFYNNFIGKQNYLKNSFTGSLVYFENTNNSEGIYNKANLLYKENNFINAIKIYKSIKSNNESIINFRINHNIANSFYRLGEQEEDNSEKLKNWENSIKFYKNALAITYDDETKKNFEFVLKKINDIRQENKKNKKDKDSEKNKELDGTKQNGNSKESSTDSIDNQLEKENNLSNEEERVLKEYEDELKNEQKRNINNFNKVYNENRSNDSFDNFLNDSFFNNSLLNSGNGEKDW